MVDGRLELADGAVVGLVVDGHPLVARNGARHDPAAVPGLVCAHAAHHGRDVVLEVSGGPVDPFLDPGPVVFRPDGSWGPHPRRASTAPGVVRPSLTHTHLSLIPEGLDLFDPPVAPSTNGDGVPDTEPGGRGVDHSPTAPVAPVVDVDSLFHPTAPNAGEHDGDDQGAAGSFLGTLFEPQDDQDDQDDQGLDVIAQPEPVEEWDAPVSPGEAVAATTDADPDADPDVDRLVPADLSRAALEAWVSGEVLNPERASQGTESIRTRTETPVLRRPVVLTAAVVFAVVCLIGLVVTVVVRDEPAPAPSAEESPKVGPYALQTVDLETGDNPDAWVVPGYSEQWSTQAPDGASVAALSHAVVISSPQGLTFHHPATGKGVGTAPVKGHIDSILTATLRTRGSRTGVKAVAWKQGEQVSLYLLDGKNKPLRKLALPAGANMSARGGGMLVTTKTRAGVVVLTKNRAPTVEWVDNPTPDNDPTNEQAAHVQAAHVQAAHVQAAPRPPHAKKPTDMWAYAATPDGQVWWLGDDGTVRLPDGSGDRTIELIQPRSGLRFSGWVGASVDPAEHSTGTLVAVWRDPATKGFHMVTHNPATGEPVSAIETELRAVQGGASGVRSTHLAIGPYLVDARSGKIVVDGGEDYRFVTVAGGVAAVRTPDGRVGMVNLSWIRAGRPLRVQPSQSNLLGADDNGNVVVQMPGSDVAGYVPETDD